MKIIKLFVFFIIFVAAIICQGCATVIYYNRPDLVYNTDSISTPARELIIRNPTPPAYIVHSSEGYFNAVSWSRRVCTRTIYYRNGHTHSSVYTTLNNCGIRYMR